MDLGENIHNLRVAHNLSQGDFADALDVSRQSVSKWENNSAVPDLEKLVKMAQLFGITLDELVSGVSPTTQPPSDEPPAERIVYVETPSAPPSPKQGLSTHQIIGIVLLGLSGLMMILFTLVGVFTGNYWLGVILGAPLLMCGLICLLCKNNIGLKCAWAVYLSLWVLLMIAMVR